MSSGFLTMIRLLFAGLILLMLSFVHGDKIFSILRNRQDALSLLFFSLVGALTVQLTFLLTIEKSNAATATVLQFLSPTIIVAWFAIVRRARPGNLVLTAIFTSLVGTFLLVTHGNPTSLSISPAALFWGIASAFAAAFYTTYPSTLIARYGTLPIVGWSMLIGGLVLLPFYAGQGSSFSFTGNLLLAFFYLVVIGTSLTFSLYLKGAQMIGGPKASILSCAEPLSSAFLSLLLLGVSFTLPDWLGTLLIVSSVILISLDSRRRVKARV
ncbi:transport protein [Yokenella regensburgei ATCC 49455]|nr:transport protein [Yokenella regensburgei ATCC 49455]